MIFIFLHNLNMEWHYWTRITFFKFEWIIDELNKLWYTHFITKEQCTDSDFKDWIWFYIDTRDNVYWKSHIYNSVAPEYLRTIIWTI